jgi:hypothetical protein
LTELQPHDGVLTAFLCEQYTAVTFSSCFLPVG